ncbi:hypothetical protein AJ88_10505 [Mesorhizobium amorphae CCBAU 01583]|nr:hypothetical protein AJ88_10505 [Mesorhizobium amorphae CCBAU 01583]
MRLRHVPRRLRISMTSIDTARLKEMFDAIAVAIEADKDRLCQLDGIIGDADHGIAMALGFGAVRDALEPLDLATTEPTALSTRRQNPSSMPSAPRRGRSTRRPSCALPPPSRARRHWRMRTSSPCSRRWRKASRIAARPRSAKRR